MRKQKLWHFVTRAIPFLLIVGGIAYGLQSLSPAFSWVLIVAVILLLNLMVAGLGLLVEIFLIDEDM